MTDKPFDPSEEPKEQEIFIPGCQPFSMSIKVSERGCAISLRFGKGSEGHPSFGKYPQEQGAPQTFGGDPGTPPICP